MVKDAEAAQLKYLVPKPTLPFYVYREGDENSYVPSAHMGDY